MRIGLDFDNTIAGYDTVFPAAARAAGLVPEDFRGGKAELRAHLRTQPEGETDWMRLQGRVYGALMGEAVLMPGLDAFLRRARAENAALFVVSHKTIEGHFDPDRVDLRAAARRWMETKGFFAEDGYGIAPADVYFEDDREAKIARIAALDLDVFIDDLEEVFREPEFPRSVRPILFTNGRGGPEDLTCRADWNAIAATVFDGR
jgi:alkylhydroperoxidase family enzyme